MSDRTQTPDVTVEHHGHVAVVEMHRPPNNMIDIELVGAVADACEALDKDLNCRAIVLAAEGKHFSGGADLARRLQPGYVETPGKHLYQEGRRLLRTRKPIVAAVQGAAIGAGLGLAAVCDFRVTCTEARFSTNFTRNGFHPGFGTTCTLPRLIGQQQAALLLYTGRRITGEEAVRIGLADLLVPLAEVRAEAIKLAHEIASSAPLAVQATRITLRRGLADAFDAATERESFEQNWTRQTEDYSEGVKAMAERRLPNFKGR